MTTIREQCLGAFAAAIGGIPGVAVERNRGEPVDAYPALVMIDGGQTVRTPSTGLALYTLKVGVEAWLIADSDEEIGPAISALYGQIVAAALADHTLGGVAIDTREIEMTDPEIDREEGHGPGASFLVLFEIDFETAEGNPSALP